MGGALRSTLIEMGRRRVHDCSPKVSGMGVQGAPYCQEDRRLQQQERDVRGGGQQYDPEGGDHDDLRHSALPLGSVPDACIEAPPYGEHDQGGTEEEKREAGDGTAASDELQEAEDDVHGSHLPVWVLSVELQRKVPYTPDYTLVFAYVKIIFNFLLKLKHLLIIKWYAA